MAENANDQDNVRTQPDRHSVIRWFVMATVGVLLISAVVLTPPYLRQREATRSRTCLANMKAIGLALTAYAVDHDGWLPPAETWCDSTLSYALSHEIYICPSLARERCGYAFNRRLGSVRVGLDFSSGSAYARRWRHSGLDPSHGPAETPMAFDARGGWNLAGGPELLAPRHGQGFNVVFADTHTKWQDEEHLASAVWDPRTAATHSAPASRDPVHE